MEYKSCLQKQAEIKKVFALFETPDAIYAKVIEMGRALPPFPKEEMIDENLVAGCQSRLYLTVVEKDGKLQFQAFSEALISAGLAALLIQVYSDEPAEAVLKCPPHFLDTIGIFSSLSPGRSNGLRSLHLKMQQKALKYLVKK